LKPLADKHRVVIATHIEPVPNVFGNATAVEQAIYNVVKNSITYSKQGGGMVTIFLSHENGQRAVIKVTDNGEGIQKEKLQHIFEPFYRASDDEHAHKGSGLGLALVFEIMKLHNGSIEVQSKKEEGTKMVLAFPLWSERDSSARDEKNNTVVFNFQS